MAKYRNQVNDMTLQSLHPNTKLTQSTTRRRDKRTKKKITYTQIDLDKTYKNKLHRPIVVIKWHHHAPLDALKLNQNSCYPFIWQFRIMLVHGRRPVCSL